MKKQMILSILFLLSISAFAKPYSIFQLNGNYGLIDENRNILFEPIYNSINITEQGYIICDEKNWTPKIFDSNCKEIISFQKQDFFWQFSEHEWVFRNEKGGGYKLINLKTKDIFEKIEIKSRDNCPTFVNGVGISLTYYDELGKYGYTIENRNGKTIVSNIAQIDGMYSEGVIPVLFFDGKSGYLDYNGNLVIEVPLYEDYRMEGLRISPSLNYSFHEGLAFIQTKEDHWYLLNKEGDKKILPSDYKFVTRRYSNGLTVVENKENKFGYMDKNFKINIPCKFESAYSFEGKYAAVIYQGKDAVVDAEGHIYFCAEFK